MWPGAHGSPALFLNRRGGRLTTRGASAIIAGIAEAAALDDPATAHVLRHTCATILVRGGTDLVTVAQILGHARDELIPLRDRWHRRHGHPESTGERARLRRDCPNR